MKYLKIAALFSLINAIFFGLFLYVLYSQNLSLKSQLQNASASVPEQAVGAMPETATTSPASPATSSPAAGKDEVKSAPAVQNPIPAAPKPSAPTPSQAPPAESNRCIITISGQRYDVTDFRSQHPGGDIFACGTDMTQTFFGQHDQQLLDSPEMAKLKVR